MHSFNQVMTCFIDLLSVNFALSDSASLHSRGPGLSHSTLLFGRPLCGHYDCRGGGHYVCAKNRLLHGEDTSAGPAETTDTYCK